MPVFDTGTENTKTNRSIPLRLHFRIKYPRIHTVHMAQLDVHGEILEVEMLNEQEGTKFYLEVQYLNPHGHTRSDRWALPDDIQRSDLTADWLEETLADWQRGRSDVVRVTEFTIEKIDMARNGFPVEGAEGDLDGAESRATDRSLTINGERFTVGDRVAYHVDGPESSVYGHTTEAVIRQLPPLDDKETAIRDERVKIYTGDDTKVIPTSWIIGLAADVEIDNPRSEL